MNTWNELIRDGWLGGDASVLAGRCLPDVAASMLEATIPLRDAFVDPSVTELDVVEGATGVAAQLVVAGIDRAGWMATPPSCLPVTFDASLLLALDGEGVVVGHRCVIDTWAIARQVQLVPAEWDGDRLLGPRASEPPSLSSWSGAPTLYEWVGGMPRLIELFEVFYRDFVARDELIGPLFAGMDEGHPVHVAAWMAETMGGPTTYTSGRGGYRAMLGHHVGLGLTEAQRARWVGLLGAAVDQVGLPADPEFRSAFAAYVEWGTRLALANSQPGAQPPADAPTPRWGWGVAPPWAG